MSSESTDQQDDTDQRDSAVQKDSSDSEGSGDSKGSAESDTDSKTDDTDQKSDGGDGGDDGDQQDLERYESGQLAEKPEPTEEHKKKAAESREAYTEERPTTVLPGSDHTVTGTAVNEWLDDDGNPKFGDDKEIPDDEGHRTVAKTDERDNVAE